MPEKTGERINLGLMMGGLLVALGAATFLAELNPAAARVIFQLWPAGLIGVGVALLVPRRGVR